MIVGTQVDLRNDESVRDKLAKQKMVPVSRSDGESMARQLGAVKYVECSALTQYKLKDVFDEVSQEHLQKLPKIPRALKNSGVSSILHCYYYCSALYSTLTLAAGYRRSSGATVHQAQWSQGRAQESEMRYLVNQPWNIPLQIHTVSIFQLLE